ncbi:MULTISPECIES: hypothetical protein [unclassified Streptomyces]|uniref:hypothetical protein n=1 Tax=unclassified Streptomyces TaxID=2593676 RepID=UPI0015F7A342|nr:hypothetical protein [Streptomyces sp. GMR22]MBA6441306.1 hypothetical protein [Streptomyces sp. GMR22]
MATLAVTGHMDLTSPTRELVRDALRDLLARRDDAEGALVGVSCIAPGADTLFAEAVLEAGGALVVVVPSLDYRRSHVTPDHAPVFDRLMAAASEVVPLPFGKAGREAYEAANAELLRRADTLIAVWDGTPPSGKGGGTADSVRAARSMGIPVRTVWPRGSARNG